jgi:hypothetical protein
VTHQELSPPNSVFAATVKLQWVELPTAGGLELNGSYHVTEYAITREHFGLRGLRWLLPRVPHLPSLEKGDHAVDRSGCTLPVRSLLELGISHLVIARSLDANGGVLEDFFR